MLDLLARCWPSARATIPTMCGAHGSGEVFELVCIVWLANVLVLYKGSGGDRLKWVVWQGWGIGGVWDYAWRGMLEVGVGVDVVVLRRYTMAWWGVVTRHVFFGVGVFCAVME